MKLNKKITLIIITYNRSYYIERLLKYYSLKNFDQNIIVADASDNDSVKNNKIIYKSLESNLSLTVKYLPGYSIVDCVDSVLDGVTTPYVVFHPDDDFFIPSALIKMTNFLDKNPDYSGVNGKAIVQEERELSNGQRSVHNTTGYSMRELIGSDSIDRVDNLLGNYFGILFSVFRKDALKKAYYKIPGNGIIAFELIPACRAASIGNIGHLDMLFLVRSVHRNRVYIPGFYDAILEPDWSDNIKVFKDDFNRITNLDQKNVENKFIFEKIIKKYYARDNSKFKFQGNIFLRKAKNFFYVLFNLTEIYILKGIKNPFYLGSNELKLVLDVVEEKKENFK